MSVITRPPRDGLVRAQPRLQLRAAGDAEEEESGSAMPTLVGIFTRFDEVTEINSYYEGNFIERIARGAFAQWFAEELESIRCLFQHGMDFQVGDKPLGPIESLIEGAEGPEYEVPLLDADYVREIVPGLRAKLYGASFRFRVTAEKYEEEPGPSEGNPKGLPERTILQCEVPEFGPVTFPAYAGATAGLRSMTDDYLACRFQRDPEGLEAVIDRAANPGALLELFAARGVRSATRSLPTRTAPAAAEPAVTETTPAAEPPATEPVTTEAPARAEETPTEGDEAPETAETPGNGPEAETEPAAPPERAAPSDGRTPTEVAKPAADRSKENRMTLEEIRARQEKIRSRLTEIDEAHRDAELPEDIQTEYDGLETERATNDASIESIERRQANVRSLAQDAGNREAERPGDGTFRATQNKEDPYDVEAIMSRARSAPSMSTRGRIMQDAALRAIDAEKVLFHERVDAAQAKEHMENVLRREGRIDDIRSEVAERIIHTGGEMYQRSFVKALSGAPQTPEEQRALATFVGNEGGFAVPYQLDPTLVPTSNGSVNPFRAIAKKVTTISNEWKGVTSGAITPVYAEEAAEAGDNTPVLAQPTANPERCHAFVPYSYELEGDWSAALTEMAGLISEGKDDTEAVKFLEGAGHGSKEPEGLLTGATTVVKAGGTAAFAIADYYKVEQQLPARFRPNAQWLGNRAIYNLVRQFDTAGGAALWMWLMQGLGNNGPTPGNVDAKLGGYPVNEVSSMKEVLTTGTKILTIGDFSKFLIIDRIGMDMQVIPNLFGPNGRPTGQRGLYAIWRNTSKVLVKGAFRTIETS